jgi:hypothetical protein
LRGLGDSASFAYLADIAELEMARVRAYYATDVVRVGAQALSSFSAERLDELRVILHPSVSLIASPFPIVTIWEAYQSDERDGMIDRWGAEAALVAKPFVDVEIWRLPAGGHAFTSAVHEGATVAEAAEAGMVETPDFDLASNLATLIKANIVIGADRDIKGRTLSAPIQPPDHGCTTWATASCRGGNWRTQYSSPNNHRRQACPQ